MKNIKYILLPMIILLGSCDLFIKEIDLGNEFILSEYDCVDRRILYRGVETVPMTVTYYAFNENWILAKSNSRDNINEQYWVINKNFDSSIIKPADKSFDKIKQFIHGPMELDSFINEIECRQIDLRLQKI